MRKINILFCAAALLLLAGACAKQGTVGKNYLAKMHFDAWVETQQDKHPEYLWEETPLGCWILAEKEGTGELIGACDDSIYIRYDITKYDLQGNVLSTNLESVARKVKTYSPFSYYGPSMSLRTGNALYVGCEQLLSGMRVGGYKAGVIPGWLMSSSVYSKASDYVSKVTGTNQIYEIRVVEAFTDVEKWEMDSLYRYVAAAEGLSPSDTLTKGFFYVQEKAPSTTEEMPSDTTVYINYTGRLLNGKVFDTTISSVAKDNGIHSPSKTYKPVSVVWAGDHENITLGGSSVVEGFSYMLSKMKPYEKGRAIFWSSMGYTYKGSGTSIPPYSPLIFEVELVDKE